MTSQWQDYYGSEEPVPVSDEYDWPKELNGRIEQASYSRGATVRLFRDDSGDAYAVHDGDVLDAGADHARVVQSAIDHVHQRAVFPSDPSTEIVKGWVSGGGERFVVDGSTHLKDQVGLRDIDLDANDNDLGGDPVLDIAPTDGRTFIQKPVVRGVAARNNGNGPGIRSYQQAWGMLSNLTASGNSGDGFRLEGGFVVVFNGHSRENDGNGYTVINTDIAANINRLIYPNVSKSGGYGIHADWNSVRNDDNDLLTVEWGNFGYNAADGLLLGDGARSAIVRGNWFEPTDASSGIVVDGTDRQPKFNYLEQNITESIDVRNAEKTILRRNFGPDYSGLDITITADAVDTYLENNHYIGGGLTDNGVRTVQQRFGADNLTKVRAAFGGSSAQSVPSGTDTTVTYNITRFDQRGEFDTATHAFVPDLRGQYNVEAAVLWTNSIPAGTHVETKVLKNGTPRSVTNAVAHGGNYLTRATAAIVDCAPGDEITVAAKQDSGGSQDIVNSSNNTYLNITRA